MRQRISFIKIFREAIRKVDIQKTINLRQQSRIEQQETEFDAQAAVLAEQKAINEKLQAEFNALKKLVCSQKPTAEISQP